MGPLPFSVGELYDKSFRALIENKWSSLSIPGFAGFSFIKHLSLLAREIHSWRQNSLNQLATRKATIIEEISEIDRKEEANSFDSSDHLIRRSLKGDLSAIVLKEARRMSQRCKRMWLWKGMRTLRSFTRSVQLANEKDSYLKSYPWMGLACNGWSYWKRGYQIFL